MNSSGPVLFSGIMKHHVHKQESWHLSVSGQKKGASAVLQGLKGERVRGGTILDLLHALGYRSSLREAAHPPALRRAARAQSPLGAQGGLRRPEQSLWTTCLVIIFRGD